jgi:flagella basal body P-ring formation protein FlgA
MVIAGWQEAACGDTLTARVTIYPGDVVSQDMISERSENGSMAAGDVIGKVARRTLLPGQAITPAALKRPDVVRAGKPVTLVLAIGGLLITARGTAVQSGAAGDIVSVHMQDGGALVKGVARADGSVQVEE